MTIIAYDTETTGLKSFKGDRPYIFSFCTFDMESWAVTFKVNPYTRAIEFDPDKYQQLVDIFAREDVTWIGHNILFDLFMTESIGIKTDHMKVHDTMLQSKVIHGGLNTVSHGLKSLAQKILGQGIEDEKDLHDSAIQARRDAKIRQYREGESYKADYHFVEDGSDVKYAIKDAERTMLLYKCFVKKLKRNQYHMRTYKREMQVFHVVKAMIQKGMCVFPENMAKCRKWNEKYIEKQVDAMKKLGFEPENYNSNAQRVEYFFNERKFPVTKRTASGNPSIDKTVLIEMSLTDKVAEHLVEYDTASKMIGSFLDNYNRFRVYDRDQGCHVINPGYKQCGTVTGRFSSSEPNLQQVASEDSAGRVSKAKLTPRKLFGPRPGNAWYAIDMSQMEVIVFAALSCDREFIDVIAGGRDCHASVATQIWGEEEDFKKNFKKYRKRAKVIMLGMLYGMGIKKLCLNLGVSLVEGKKIKEEYNQTFPAVQKFSQQIMRTVKNEYKLVNPYGRTYYFENTEFAYKGINYLVQGTSADMIKSAMIEIHEHLKRSESFLVAQIHDEAIIESSLLYDKGGKEMIAEVMEIMSRGNEVIGFPIPMPLTLAYTEKDWSSLEDIQL